LSLQDGFPPACRCIPEWAYRLSMTRGPHKRQITTQILDDL